MNRQRLQVKVEPSEQEKHESLMNHIILPRYLPQHKSSDIHSEELALMSNMLENVESFKQWMPKNAMNMLRGLGRVHRDLTPANVSNEIRSLKPGQTFAMFVRRQNCALMVHMPEDINANQSDRVIVSTFPGTIHPKHIQSAESDIEYHYPVQAVSMPYSKMIRSEEFADQLCFLYQEIPIDKKNRNYVSKWLFTLLTDANSETIDKNEYPIITKKFRDELMGENNTDFFRRSSFYMCTKVFLQHSLTVELGENKQSKLLYKLIMMQFITRMIDEFNKKSYETLNIDLMSQSLAKLARRIEKLSDLKKSTRASGEYNQLYEQVVKRAKITIEQIRRKMDAQIDRLQKNDEQNSQLSPLNELNFELDVLQKIPNLTEYLEKAKNEKMPNRFGSRLQVRTVQRYYHMNETNPPNVNTFSAISNEIDKHLIWSDFENWILYVLDHTSSYDPIDLRTWSFAYTSFAETFYKDDRLGISRMILVRLKIISILDLIASKTYPLFREHRSGINPKIIESLLLPQQQDMKIAYDLEQYFQRRNVKAKDPGLIEEQCITARSFAAKYGAENVEMQQVLQNIKEIEEKSINEKYREWQNERDRVARLRDSKPLCCSTYTTYYGQTRHDRYCSKCRIEKEIQNVKIEQYERPLPEHTYEKNAVVFELNLPREISCLRDVLYEFTLYCNKDKNSASIKGDWIDYHQIKRFNRSESIHIRLGSSSKCDLQRYHVDGSFDLFVVKNRYNCVLHASKMKLPSSILDDSIKKVCTFEVEEEEYRGLQWTLNGTQHTQNQVIACQSKCPQLLSLSEFKNFGSLRADGHRTQLRNLYAIITTESLSFEKSSVLSLIMQTLWEAGISGDCDVIRESHADFNDSNFVTATIEMLSNYCEQQKSNWVHPMKLLMVSFITARMFEINNDKMLIDDIVKLFVKIRTIALDWIREIENAINDIQNPNLSSEQELRMKLVIVSIAGAITFFINSTHPYFDRIFVENTQKYHSASRVWLEFVITLSNNVQLYAKQTPLSSNLQMFLRIVRNTGIHIEPNIRLLMKQHPMDIFDLIKQQWTRAESGNFTSLYSYEKCPEIFVIHVMLKDINYVTIDVVTGQFLVNNLPVSRLPNNITKTAIFQRVFGNFIFEVQPDTQNSFAAVHKYNDCSYEFRWIGNKAIIIERQYGNEKELIPHDIMFGEIPHHLIENYSHFWNKTTNTIEFRPKLFSDDNFSTEDGIEYSLNLDEKHLIHIKTKRFMLDINSPGYLKITKQLSRLESAKFIHILTEKDNPRIAKAELIRMQLKFIVDCTKINCKSYDIRSNEYNRMRVSLKQNCGTLYGMRHGLLLESVPSEQLCESKLDAASTKLLLIPNGDINTTLNGLHVSVSIDIDSGLFSPPFYVYEIDDFCRQLKASNSNFSAWFYLAYLHAVTSHGEMEPFIKMSGTERALQILQSGYAWSSSPYDNEATKMLHKIANLSPIRKSIESWQQITWPNFIPPRSAQDTFIFIAQRLLHDSQRLCGLYPKVETDMKMSELKIESNLNQNKRQYLRCLPFMPNLRVSDEFIGNDILKTSTIDASKISVSQQTQTISILYHRNAYKVPDDLDLKNFLMSNRKLEGILNMNSVPNLLKHQVYASFENLWIPLYEYARIGKLNREQFTMIWSVLTHEEKSFAPILALQAVAMNSNHFKSIEPPSVDYYVLHEGTFKSGTVSEILKKHSSLPAGYYSDEYDSATFDRELRSSIDHLTSIVTTNWPCDTINLAPYCSNTYISIQTATTAINRHLKIWNENRKLSLFIQNVQETLQTLNGSIHFHMPFFNSISFPNPVNWSKYEIDYKQKMCESINDFNELIKEANSVWNGHGLTRSSDEWWSIYGKIVNGSNSWHLINAGMYPRMVPTLVLPNIVSKESNPLKMVIGALAITIAHEQRKKRIEIYSTQSQFRMDMEKKNEPHVNWKPYEYPEWLLFEIEQNLTIRCIQVDVARHMMKPTNIGSKHSVMQLNMGEGKTAVIAPIIATVLANGKQACQITVLKSLFATNLKLYRRYLGGMLNRRMYVFPCRRDMPIAQHVGQMMNIYKECEKMKGVILTTPEWRLSFQLKIYESTQRLEYETAAHFLSVHKWINANVRSILDESDAILHAKYQLIYTLGNQLPLDGGAHRWFVIQAVLKRVPEHMKRLNAKLGSEKVEFDENYVEKGHVFGSPKVNYRSDVFTPCRLLDATVYNILKSYLIEDFLNGDIKVAFPEMRESSKNGLRHLLSEKNISKQEFDEILKDFSLGERNIIMTMSGLLRFEVLKLVLMRRWRVNYGVNEKGHRKMAIPFKAKDVAAEMTEFGHIDVALCFTHLSYYYSGLTDDQLKQTFKLLSVSQNAHSIYDKWVESVPSKLVDASIKSYTGVNLSDPHQREEILFPIYKYNMHAIDFYLSNVVFPREAKTFEKKLMCTAWDLCSEHMKNSVTGFSGTNDTKNILPLPIAQNDLPHLESTNEDVRKTLLLPENQSYESLPANVSGMEIIKRLVEQEIPVLLDAGALMLELNNLQVATKWLELSTDTYYDAAIYFDARDILQTIDRNGIITEFDCSVYRDNLNKCLVYLDDVHTRGTDLKFPPNWKACVTLSGDITRDKTVQACMRMRQLGKMNGHSISFWPSFEADVKIRELCESALPHECTPNDHVIEFICKNSKTFETENIVHWSAGAYNYTKKLIGHKLYEHSTDKASLTSLLNTCVDGEYVKLEEIYGDKEDALIVNIAQSKFDQLIKQFQNNENVVNFIETIKNAVHTKIMEHAPNVKRFIQALDEEQEKELEHELEQEIHIERPAAMSPAIPHFDEQFKKLFLSGAHKDILFDLMNRGSIVSLTKGLQNTQLIRDYANESAAWSSNIVVSNDLIHVLANQSNYCDEYLRPIWWIGLVKYPNGGHLLVLLSPYECNRLISTFKESKQSVLFMYRSRLSKLHDNLLHQTKLQMTGMSDNEIPHIDIDDEVQIGIYSGTMYFATEIEQEAYCKFLGLIPRCQGGRPSEFDDAVNAEIIQPNGFVMPEHRSYSKAVKKAVATCKFKKNPVALAIKLIEAHHHLIRKESHVASILESGFKMTIEKNSTK